jgi:cytochrome c oxidase subunit 4
MLRTQTLTLLRSAARPAATTMFVVRRAATTHAISNPTLANIEKRWEGMPLQEQAELWMSLRDRMKAPWQELTLQEKKAGAYTTRLMSSSECGFGFGCCLLGCLRTP